MFRAKKAKVQTESSPTIEGAESLSNASRIINSFTTAFKCYELMHSTADLQTGRGCGLTWWRFISYHLYTCTQLFIHQVLTSNIIPTLYTSYTIKTRYMYRYINKKKLIQMIYWHTVLVWIYCICYQLDTKCVLILCCPRVYEAVRDLAHGDLDMDGTFPDRHAHISGRNYYTFYISGSFVRPVWLLNILYNW